MKITSLTDAFQGYMKACYFDGVTPSQLHQVKQAFFSGAFIVCGTMVNEVPDLSEDEAVAAIADLQREINQALASRIEAAVRRN